MYAYVIAHIIKHTNNRANDKLYYLIKSAVSCRVVIIRLGLNLYMKLNCVNLRSNSYYAYTTQKHGSTMHVAFFYSSNAIDRVNILTLLPKLESRGAPTFSL